MSRRPLTPLRPHNKQFLLARTAYQAHDDWVRFNLDNGFVLSCCPHLRVAELTSQDGRTFYLLGHAVRTDRLGRSVEGDFHLHPADAIEDWTTCWTGRWVLVGPTSCQPDAGASLGIVHRRTGSGADAQSWVSSSTALLAEASAAHGPVQPIAWGVRHAHGMDWVPAPFTGMAGIDRLAPLHRLDYVDGTVRPLAVPSFANAVTERPSAGGFAERLRIAAQNTTLLDHPTTRVALTAGLDTRTVLAAAVASGIEVETYTVASPWVVQHDLVLPPQLSAQVLVPHHTVVHRPSASDGIAARVETAQRHLAGNGAGGPLRNLTEGRLEFAQAPGTLFLVGATFEIGRCFYWNRFAQAGASARLPDPDTILRAFPDRERSAAPWREAAARWVETARDQTHALDWRDRFYLDQRLGSWLAGYQQVWDMVGGTSFPLGNGLALFAHLLRPDTHQRRAGWLQRQAIHVLEPRLARYPINPLPRHVVLARAMRERLKGRWADAIAERLSASVRRLRAG
ncbi:hypothetical protein [Marinivivus vitaminiproducens]|uniref:hypothetical protein n=1 Tax=Marinivivus vitaminiproducens TaxID=3035935 RepID=UPI0027A5240E|nr:hypothetical protein P4R82_07240 [Geminicoccaceae bacterium SCSIO 64248]